ncbi:hypothetical protein CASFOL_034372 [Castilleja foliolosa]|uniref:Uncharacterized protein n=1 Tax=Castilleja foliolosa TaxID=1961234 RepID=A0ABD3BWS6_9LAMI
MAPRQPPPAKAPIAVLYASPPQTRPHRFSAATDPHHPPSWRRRRHGMNAVVNGEVKIREKSSKFPLTAWEVTVASGVVLDFFLGLVGLYLTMPASDYNFLKLPRTLQDLQILRWDGGVGLKAAEGLEGDGAPAMAGFYFPPVKKTAQT